jgi:hypothetical protein
LRTYARIAPASEAPPGAFIGLHTNPTIRRWGMVAIASRANSIRSSASAARARERSLFGQTVTAADRLSSIISGV